MMLVILQGVFRCSSDTLFIIFILFIFIFLIAGAFIMSIDIHLRRRLLYLTVPIFIEILLVMLLGFMDIIMLSQVSDNDVASVGIVNQILMTVTMIFMVGATGASVLCAQYIGAGQQENFTKSVGVALIFNAIIGLSASFIFYFYSREILTFMDINPKLMENSLTYATIVGLSLVFVSLSMAVSVALRSCNLTRYPMYVSLVINICNIMGNYVLIFGKFGFPALGVEGAAISTVCSRGVSLVLLVVLLMRYALKLPLFANMWPFPWDKLKKMLFIGLPSAGELLSYTISQMVIMYFINQLGTEAVAARTYLVNFIMFTFLFALSIGQGSSILVGQLIGKNKNKAALLLGGVSIRASIYVSVVLSSLLALCAPFILPIVTDNARIAAICLTIFWVDILLEIGRAVNITGGKLLGAVGNPQYPFVIGLIFMWSMATLGSYVFGVILGFGLLGMWIAFILDETIRGFLIWRRWQSRKWENRGFVKKIKTP